MSNVGKYFKWWVENLVTIEDDEEDTELIPTKSSIKKSTVIADNSDNSFKYKK